MTSCNRWTLLWAFILWPISGIGITGGVHRLWAHRSYKASFPLRVYLMLSNSIANQGSIWHWARDHRVHHKHSEVILFCAELFYLVLSHYLTQLHFVLYFRLTQILTTPPVDSFSRTWDGYLSRSTLRSSKQGRS